MAEKHRKDKTDRHRWDTRGWRPDPALYGAALKAARQVAPSLNAYLCMSIEYLLGLRKDPPPRPGWAEERAAGLPDSDHTRPSGDTEN